MCGDKKSDFDKGVCYFHSKVSGECQFYKDVHGVSPNEKSKEKSQCLKKPEHRSFVSPELTRQVAHPSAGVLAALRASLGKILLLHSSSHDKSSSDIIMER